MKIYYDEKVDLAYLRFSDAPQARAVEVSEGVKLDLTKDGKIVGIEILNAAKKFPIQSLFTCEYDPKMMMESE